MRIFPFICAIALAPVLSYAEFKAGSALTDVSPQTFPVIANGGMTSRSVEKLKTPLKARSLAFSDGKETVVIVIVDSCMMPRPLLDEVKQLAAKQGSISPDRILISATHTHTAGSCMGVLGTDTDPIYTLLLKKKLVEAVLAPLKKMQPAQIGWGEVDAGKYTALRRWVLRPDRLREDPFGNFTVRSNMHAGADWDNVTGKSGPEDPLLRMISVKSEDGKPIGLLCNFSMHYFGDRDISADYFGLFSNGLQEQIAPEDSSFVAMMSHGCSGDIWRHDYEASADRKDPNQQWTIEEYSQRLVDLALTTYQNIDYEIPDSVAMDETRMTLKYRVPDKQRLEWSRKIVESMGDRLPKTKEEVYAREQIILDERQETEIVVQGLRIGENISIATTPNETYALTGLKINNASPTDHTMVIELANGGDGYIPPPEQHLLGGYNTWPARSAGLEVEAEPKITEAAIQLLEKVTGKSRQPDRPPSSEAASAILSAKPRAYYRLDETAGPVAHDESPNHLNAILEPRVLYYLRGPEKFDKGMHWNRGVHLAGDRIRTDIPNLGNDYKISLWFWNGMPASGRDETGWLVSRGREHALGDEGDHLGIGGTSGNAGTLIFFHGGNPADVAAGKTPIERWKWHHLELKRTGDKVTVHLDGKLEIDAEAPASFPADLNTLFFGGRCDDHNNFEGRIDEIAVF